MSRLASRLVPHILGILKDEGQGAYTDELLVDALNQAQVWAAKATRLTMEVVALEDDNQGGFFMPVDVIDVDSVFSGGGSGPGPGDLA